MTRSAGVSAPEERQRPAHGASRGTCGTGVSPVVVTDIWGFQVNADRSGDTCWGFEWPRYLSAQVGPIPTTGGVGLPLWFVLAITAIPTAILFYRDRRRIPPGHCQKCGYNLTGNVSGICPECGEPIPIRAHRAR